MFINYLAEYLKNHTLDDLSNEYGIKSSIYPTGKEHDLVIFSYSQIDSPKTDPIVRMSRGTVLEKDTWKIVNFPFYRFYNFEEVLTERQFFNWDKAVSTEKVDGSLISYFCYEGTWYMSTRSMIGGENRITSNLYSFKDLFLKAIAPLTEAEFAAELNPQYCYTFELVSPFNQIVTPYKDTNLYFIGVRYLGNVDYTQYQELPFNQYYANNMSEKLKAILKLPKIVSLTDEQGHFRGFDEMKALSESVDTTDEGFVVTDWSTLMDQNNSFPRVKVKNSAYVALHHLRSSIDGEEEGVSYAKILVLLFKNEQDEFLAVLPQYKDIFNVVAEKWQIFADYMNAIVNEEKFKEFLARSIDERIPYKKEFALYIKDKKYASVFFNMYNKGYKTWHESIAASNSLDNALKKIWMDVNNWK